VHWRSFSFFVCLFSFALSTSAHAAAFIDVPDTHSLASTVEYGIRRGLIRIPAQRTFRPDAAITRPEFAVMLARAILSKEMVTGCVERAEKAGALQRLRLSDADYGSWYGDSLCALQLGGIFGGFADGTFQPLEGVRFAEAAKAMALGFGFTALAVPTITSDDWQILAPYAKFLSSRKAIPTDIRGLQYPVTRGQTLIILHRLMEQATASRLPVTAYQIVEHLGKDDASLPWIGHGVRFEMAKDWPPAHTVKRRMKDAWFPHEPPLLSVHFGQQRSCYGHGACLNRDFRLDLYPIETGTSLLDAMHGNGRIRILEDRRGRVTRIVRYAESGQTCDAEGLFALGRRYAYRLLYPCARTQTVLYADWLRVLRTFTMLPLGDPESRR
jgi:hypothetical protein